MYLFKDKIKYGHPYKIPISTNRDLYNLSVIQLVGDHPFTIDFNVADINVYPSLGRLQELKNCISEYVGCSPSNILVSNGSGKVLELILKALNRPKVLIPIPNYPGFIHDAEILSDVKLFRFMGEMKEYPALEEEIKTADVVYFSTPNIPIGYEIDYDMVCGWIANYPDKIFIIDEAYFEYGENKTFFMDQPNIIVVRTFSKAFMMAGMRVGYAIACEQIIKYLSVVACDKDVSDFSVFIAIKAMENKYFYLNKALALKSLRDKLSCDLSYLIKPGDFIYNFSIKKGIFFLIETINTDFCSQLFLKNKFLVRDKSSDLPNTIRIQIVDEKIYLDLLEVIKKINGRGDYKEYIFDLDLTIRPSYTSPPYLHMIETINRLSNDGKLIHIATNNYMNNIEEYLDEYIDYMTLKTPFGLDGLKDFKWQGSGTGFGIYTYGDTQGVLILGFPAITFELIDAIKKHGIIFCIEKSDAEGTSEHGFQAESNCDFYIPGNTRFLNLLKEYVDYKLILIGKESWDYHDMSPDTIVIGDSDYDLQLAMRHNFYFKKINKNDNTTPLFV